MSSSLTSSTISTTSNVAVGGTLSATGATSLSSTLAVTGSTTLSSTLNVQERINCFVTTAANSTSVTVNPFVTFPSAGVYMLFISHCSGTTSSTPELIDNLAKLFIVICSTLSTQNAQVITLYNPSNGWMSISNTSQLSIGLTVSAGSFTYRAFYQKIF